ncbi:MAG TPA: wax ester/triacylglycerol synthase family O-acyltransferase [Actinomycetota bacterium]|nr:wax ester/triacylglycerol synthase family O-acyltransferase [Actinomycetota bacterium]
MPAERLSGLDASFLYLEKPGVHMHVAGLSIFAARADGSLLTYDDVERVVEARLRLAPRLRRKLRSVPGNLSRPVWIDDDRFDLDFHLRRASVPAPGGRFELERAVGRVLSRPLDRTKPLWELYVFEDLSEDRTAILLKIHHAMADGIGNMMIASALFDLTADAPTGEPDGAWSAEPVPPMQDLIRDAVEEAVLHPIQSLVHVARQPRIVAETVSATADALRTVAGMGTAPRGPFDGRVGPNRRFATAERPFAVFRGIKESLGGTVNDVVLAAVAGGVHALLESRGESTQGRSLRAMVPVSVRSPGDGGDIGNRVAPVFVDVPVGRMGARTRLRRVRAAAARIKDSGMAVGADTIIGLGAFAPPALHAAAARLIAQARWCNLVVSNIPAPQLPLYFAGAPLQASYPAMNLKEDCGLSVACTSAAGTMAFGLTADWDRIPDIEVLARSVESEVDRLAEVAGI